MPDKRTDTSSKALRNAGFIPLPRLWVRSEDMPTIHQIAEKHRLSVNAIRGQVNNGEVRKEPTADPVDDKEAAWAAYEKLRGG